MCTAQRTHNNEVKNEISLDIGDSKIHDRKDIHTNITSQYTTISEKYYGKIQIQ